MTRSGNEVWIETASSTISRETAVRLGAFVFPPGSIIFPKVGGALLTNKRRLLRQASCIDNNVMGCVVKAANLKYTFVLLQQLDLGRLAKPGPVPAIGEGDVREIKVALPPPKEQSSLVSAVNGSTAGLDRAIAAAHHELDLLREYRTSLITAVATGKLDVREAAEHLAEEAEEPKPLDEVDTLSDSGDIREVAELDAASEEAVDG